MNRLSLIDSKSQSALRHVGLLVPRAIQIEHRRPTWEPPARRDRGGLGEFSKGRHWFVKVCWCIRCLWAVSRYFSAGDRGTRSMATLTQNSLSLSIIHLERDEHTIYMGLGLFCDGIPLLTPLPAYADPKISVGYVEVEDRIEETALMTQCLRPVLTEKRPQFTALAMTDKPGGGA